MVLMYCRKISEGKHYDIFIKYNIECTSFFACTYEFIRKYGIPGQHKKDVLGFVTDNDFYSIPWSYTKIPFNDDSDFCFDNFDHLQKLIEKILKKKYNPIMQKFLQKCIL